MVSGIWRMSGVLWPGGREGGAGDREVERDFSRSGKDISESGEGGEIFGNDGDAGCATEILSGVEIPYYWYWRSWICECCRDKIC